MLDYLFRYLQDSPSWQFITVWLSCLLLAVLARYVGGYFVDLKVVFYAIPYFVTLLLYSMFHNIWGFWQEKGFWLLSLGILLILYSNQFLSFAKILGFEQGMATYHFARKIGYNLQCTVLYLLVPCLYGWWVGELRETSFYGCTVGKASLYPYFLMILGMLPLLIWASFREDFLQTYPRYLPTTAEPHWGISPVWTIAAYEISYVLQFLSLEIFFRGFMAFALARYVGSASVIVMVSVYAFLHFWKPMPETLGSIAGGFLLGVFAFYSRSVVGGMIIHVGIALLMETLAWGQLYRKGKF
jgi:hypothetical protein